MTRKKFDDDFVFTIEDDQEVSADELEAKPLAGAGKKRKYTEDPDTNTLPKATPKKKAKKGKKNAAADVAPEDAIAMIEPEEDTQGNDDIASDFEFQVGEVDTAFVEDFDGWGVEKKEGERKITADGRSTAVDVDEIIERRRKKVEPVEEVKDDSDDGSDEDMAFEGFADDKDDELLAEDGFGMGAESEEDNESDEEGSDASSEGGGDDEDEQSKGVLQDESDNESVAAPVPHPMDLDVDSDESEHEDETEKKRQAAFFAPEEDEPSGKKSKKGTKPTGTFQSMSLSRPILKGLASVGFTEPTPIQLKAIPIALQGKDVVGGAETGSGKTAAFLIPIMERLLYRPKKIATTRVAIFMPTRELAVQCFNVAQKLAAFTDITFALMSGGFSLREQEAVLKTRPDVVIATPGRFIDHMNNSQAFQVENLEILVLDEADRMLEEGFESQLNEILATIPKSRQTMLFSATMTNSVDKLIRVGMNRPVRLMVDAKKNTVAGLVQEFVRLRQGKEDKRLAYLMFLCEKVYSDKVIIFFRQKKEAHRVRVVFALCGLKASELHGNMSQEQRIQSVEAFRSGASSYLLATDVASRGLDIKNVSTVINYEAPQSHEIYLHRVGRTARAGRTGRACTIAAEPDRKVVKAAVKAAREQGAKVVSRQVPAEEMDRWLKKLKGMEDEIEEVLKEEKEERALSITERDLKRGENLINHEDEIKARPRRTWFESEADKETAKRKGAEVLNGPLKGDAEGALKKKTGKLSNKDRKKLEIRDVRVEGKVWKKGKEERGKGVVRAKGEGKKKVEFKKGMKRSGPGKGSRRK